MCGFINMERDELMLKLGSIDERLKNIEVTMISKSRFLVLEKLFYGGVTFLVTFIISAVASGNIRIFG